VPAMARLSADIETQLRQQQALTVVKVALAYKGDAFGKGSALALADPKNLALNGHPAVDPTNAPNYLQLDYGNPSDPTTDPLKYTQSVSAIVGLQPNIIHIIGTGEMFGNIMMPIEQQWPATVKRPYYIYAHTGASQSLVDQLNGLPDQTAAANLRKRILGITYGSFTDTYNKFASNFIAAQFPDNPPPGSLDANTSYDAFYTLVYATVSVGPAPLTGATIAAAVANLTPAGGGKTLEPVGPEHLNDALTRLAQGEKIDIDGTSGPLDFNLQTGDVAQENQVFCIPADASGKAQYPPFSGYGFDLNFKATGSITAVTTKCQVSFAP
jgi:hypothetical protein